MDRSDKGTKWSLIGGGLLVGLFSFASWVLASGGEAGGHGDSGALWDLLYRIINFALLVIVLVWAIRKSSIKDFFAGRRDEIKKTFEDMNREREEAEALRIELEKKVREFEIQKKEIIDQMRAEGRAESDKIIAQAKVRASQIIAYADAAIQREVLTAKDKLRGEMMEMAAKGAEEVIARSITDEDQDHLVNEFIERVEKLH